MISYYSVKCSGYVDTQIWVQIYTELPKNLEKIPHPKCEIPHPCDRTTYGAKIMPSL